MLAVLPPAVQSLIILAVPFALALLERKPFHKIPGLLGLENKRVGWQLLEGAKLFLLTLAVLALEVFLLTKIGFNDSGKVAEVLLKQDAITLFAVIAIAPLGEELLFRGYLQKKIGAIVSNMLFGVVLSSVLFAALHYGFGSFVELAAAFTASMLFGNFVRENKLVLPAIFAHALINAYSIATVFLFKQ